MSSYLKSLEEKDEVRAAMQARPGRHYVVGKDGRLLRLQSAQENSVGEFRVDDGKAGAKNKAKTAEGKRTTKIIFPTSSINAIKQTISYSGRYVQRANNVSMSIRDYVEAKGQRSVSSSSADSRRRNFDLRQWN